MVPHAAVLNGHAKFMILDSGPTVPSQQVLFFEHFADAHKDKGSMTPDEAEAIVLRAGIPPEPRVFEPLADLQKLNIPAIWLFGDQDWAVAPSSSIAVLKKLADEGKPYEYRLIKGAGHVIILERPEELWRNVDEWLGRTLGGL